MKVDNLEVFELPYHITCANIPRESVRPITGRIIDFLEERDYPVLNRCVSHCSLFDGELTTYGGLAFDQYFEFYNCQAGEKFRVYDYRYFTNMGGPRDFFGVMVMIDDQVLAMQLKLMLS